MRLRPGFCSIPSMPTVAKLQEDFTMTDLFNTYRIWTLDGYCVMSDATGLTPAEALDAQAKRPFPLVRPSRRYFVAKITPGNYDNHDQCGIFEIKPATGFTVEKIKV